jgi:predicted amidohydrolase YtcJ
MGIFAASGAKTRWRRKHFFAALKRCDTHKLNAVLESHPSQKTRRMGHPAFVVVFCCVAFLQAQTAAPGQSPTASGPKADVIFIHANVYTGVPSNTPFSSILREEAIAIRGDRIQAVGKTVDIQKLKGPQTQVIDLDGHFVMPGFNDAHLHLADAGLQRLSADLTGVKTLDEFRERVRAQVQSAKPGEWILGGGWDETMWPVKVLPSRWDLDEVSGGHPVFVDRVDGHLAVANTRALQLAEYHHRQPRTRKAARLIVMPTGSPRGFCAIRRREPCGR